MAHKAETISRPPRVIDGRALARSSQIDNLTPFGLEQGVRSFRRLEMQSIATMNLKRIESHAQRTRALNDAAKRLVQRVLGCWQHDLSRPFSHRGRTYRVCVKWGMARDFNPEN